ncbi:MAG: glutamate--tRNA ligase [Myxococcales bacterium]|nr:glutamate--tRNA ligase [Myxococcales bacterium]
MGPRVRFAPSPSGYLHIGGARTALFNWLWAKSQGGALILRIEDTDQERSSLDSVRAILDAMTWLGLDWQEGPEVGGPHGSYFQSERKALYRDAVEQLIRERKAYRCYCTKEILDAQRAALKERDPKAQFVYPGTCRERKDEPALPHVVRFSSPKHGTTDFIDKVFGEIRTPNEAQQDFVIVRTDGFPLYNLAAVVDDHAMGITLVARGRDHIGNTPQQVLLYQAFGWEAPEFAHLPMMMSAKGEKLSKRHASVGVQDYKDRGFSPMGVLNYLVRFGWSSGDQEIFTRDELIRLFDWARVNKSDGKFDEKKFADVAFEQLKRPDLTPLDEYAAGVRPFLAARGLPEVPADTLGAAISSIRERARTWVEAAHALDYFFREPPEMDADASAKHLGAGAVNVLTTLREICAGIETFSVPALEEAVRVWTEREQIKMKDVAQPARVALTGRTASPGLFDVMVVLGRERTVRRLEAAANLASERS